MPHGSVKGECPWLPLPSVRILLEQGIWPQYIGAVPDVAAQGELNGNNVAELLLNVAMSIAGMIILALCVTQVTR